jgi:mannose-6-phosphate isomerase-like protein (cupin superfamily)
MTEPLRAGASLTLMGDHLRVLAAAADSGGALTALEVTMRPGGGPPAMHAHDAAELVVVLEGSITAMRGDPAAPERIDAGPGQAVAIPGGQPHTIRNLGDRPGRYVTVFAPPGGMEGFIAEAAGALAGAGDGPPSPELVERVLGLAAAHGMTMFPPPA